MDRVEIQRDGSREGFRGAPTKVGRGIFFGIGLFVSTVGGVSLFVGCSKAQGWERIAPLAAGGVFVIFGLLCFSMAFPTVVRALQWRSGLLRRHGRWVFPAFLLLASVAAAGVPFLASVGVIATDSGDWPAPRWVAALASGTMLLVILWVATTPLRERLAPDARRRVDALLPLLIVTALAIVLVGLTLNPAETGGSTMVEAMGVEIEFDRGSVSFDRIAIGVGGVLASIAALLGWWRYLSDRF